MIERLSKTAGKPISARIISKTDADIYMNFSISYGTCKYCNYIISWNTVSAFLSLHLVPIRINVDDITQIVQ